MRDSDPATPFVIMPSAEAEADALAAMVAARRDELPRLLHRHGAILFRGFQLADAEGFRAVACALSPGGLDRYAGGASPRRLLAAGPAPVYDSTSYPAELELPLHNELSYADTYPERIYF